MLVLDASAAVRALVEDEAGPDDDALLLRARDGITIVPGHWQAEVVQAVARGVRLGRWSVGDARDLLVRVGDLDVTTIVDPAFASELLAAALETGLTAQDAAYLQLARDLDAPLATADGALRAAAERVGVACI